MSLAIGKYIKYRLSGITSNINPMSLPEDQTKPFIVYKRKFVNPEYSRDGLAFNVVGVQIDFVSSDYTKGIDMAERSRIALENKSGGVENIIVNDCQLTGADESFDGSLYIQTLTFELKTN